MAISWPAALTDVVERSVTVELATLTASGRPVTAPTTPYLGQGGATVDVSTGLTYPAKAERARRDPRVSLLFADPIGPGMADAPVVVVQGLATVRDADLQANTDRYVALSTAKLPATTKGRPRFALRRLGWYYARIWIEVTPLHVQWWAGRDLAGPGEQWHAAEDVAAPLSDPAPPGATPPAWIAPPRDWRPLVADALGRLPLADLTVVGDNGFPLCLPTESAALVAGGVSVRLGPGASGVAAGPACLTMHGHDPAFNNQENHSVVGTLEPSDGGWLLRVERALGDWSLVGGNLRMSAAFLSKGRALRGRLRVEAARRDQPVPVVRFPGDRAVSAP